ncbi:MAG: AAA family ATPase [Phycisphaerae bacterium]|nr:AAA family ATPase [Phycisphaerae bacterium]
MGAVIAVSGKGGTGKSTLSASLIHAMARSGDGPVLAIDADHNASLGMLLGLEVEETISDIRDRTRQAGEKVSEIPKERLLDQWLNEIVVEATGYDLISMGRPEGPGCYCYVNSLLRRYLELLRRSYPFVVIDNAAGMEHLSRLTSDDVQLLVLVSEPTYVGLTTAKRINELADSLPLKIGKRVLVINKVGPEGVASKAMAVAETVAVDARIQIGACDALARLSITGEGVTPEAEAAVAEPVGRLLELCREAAGKPAVKG